MPLRPLLLCVSGRAAQDGPNVQSYIATNVAASVHPDFRHCSFARHAGKISLRSGVWAGKQNNKEHSAWEY